MVKSPAMIGSMLALLERLELAEATSSSHTAAIKKQVAAYEKKQWDWVNSQNPDAANRAGYERNIPAQAAELTKALKSYWGASRKIDRMLDGMEQGDAKADPAKTRKALESLDRKLNKSSLEQDSPDIGADRNRLFGRFGSAEEKLRTIERQRTNKTLDHNEKEARIKDRLSMYGSNERRLVRKSLGLR